MKTRLLSYRYVLTLATAFLVACGGEQPVPETPPPPEPAAPEPAPPAEPAAVAPEEPKKAEAPPPKPNREKIVGKWSLDFSGELKTAAEEDAKKKGIKDETKLADALKKAEEATVKRSLEATADTVNELDGDKAVRKFKYEVVKEEGNTLILKAVGKDEITKKELAGEQTLTFRDDNTIELKELGAKDPAKAKLLVYKRAK